MNPEENYLGRVFDLNDLCISNAEATYFVRNKVRLAGAGYDTTWHHKQQWMSPACTTKWREVLGVK